MRGEEDNWSPEIQTDFSALADATFIPLYLKSLGGQIAVREFVAQGLALLADKVQRDSQGGEDYKSQDDPHIALSVVMAGTLPNTAYETGYYNRGPHDTIRMIPGTTVRSNASEDSIAKEMLWQQLVDVFLLKGEFKEHIPLYDHGSHMKSLMKAAAETLSKSPRTGELITIYLFMRLALNKLYNDMIPEASKTLSIVKGMEDTFWKLRIENSYYLAGYITRCQEIFVEKSFEHFQEYAELVRHVIFCVFYERAKTSFEPEQNPTRARKKVITLIEDVSQPENRKNAVNQLERTLNSMLQQFPEALGPQAQILVDGYEDLLP